MPNTYTKLVHDTKIYRIFFFPLEHQNASTLPIDTHYYKINI